MARNVIFTFWPSGQPALEDTQALETADLCMPFNGQVEKGGQRLGEIQQGFAFGEMAVLRLTSGQPVTIKAWNRRGLDRLGACLKMGWLEGRQVVHRSTWVGLKGDPQRDCASCFF